MIRCLQFQVLLLLLIIYINLYSVLYIFHILYNVNKQRFPFTCLPLIREIHSWASAGHWPLSPFPLRSLTSLPCIRPQGLTLRGEAAVMQNSRTQLPVPQRGRFFHSHEQPCSVAVRSTAVGFLTLLQRTCRGHSGGSYISFREKWTSPHVECFNGDWTWGPLIKKKALFILLETSGLCCFIFSIHAENRTEKLCIHSNKILNQPGC